MNKELKNVLVPIDFKAPSIKALKYGLNLVKKFKGELILLHVIETPGILADFFSSGNELVKVTDNAKNKLVELVSALTDAQNIKIINKVERGKPYEVILNIAQESKSRFIVLGENHEGEGANQNIGSTVYHVTLKAPIPVLTLKGNNEIMGKKILVPIDLTKQVRKQLYSAMTYGLSYDAEIYLVSALIGGIKVRDSRIYKKLKLAKKTLSENGVKCHTHLFKRSDEPPFRKVIDYANEINADLILIMTHKEGYTYDNYIGAFAHHIINKSKVPVLSLTSAATNIDYTQFFQDFVDPAGLFKA